MMSCRIAKHGAVSRINSAQASRNVHGGGRAPWILQAKVTKGGGRTISIELSLRPIYLCDIA
jgi:hypothetical protein